MGVKLCSVKYYYCKCDECGKTADVSAIAGIL